MLFPAWYYSVTFALASILPAVTSATLFRALYKFQASQTGLALGLGTLIGSTLGELLGGVVVDRSMYLSRKGKQNDEIVPEVRLQGIWAGAVLQPVSVLCLVLFLVIWLSLPFRSGCSSGDSVCSTRVCFSASIFAKPFLTWWQHPILGRRWALESCALRSSTA